jgi:type IV pilus assembly protein PilM
MRLPAASKDTRLPAASGVSLLTRLFSILQDPPPEFAFEIAPDGIGMLRTRPAGGALQHVPLKPGTLSPSPVRENVLDPAAFADAVRRLVPPATRKARRSAALILPDNCVRIAVLDFDTLPDKEEERRSLINFRLRKSVPFDVDQAALSYFPQAGKKVIVTLAPSEIVSHYEAPFRAAGLQPGLVTVSSLAIVDLLPTSGSLVLAHRSPGALTILALSNGVVTIARTLEIADVPQAEVISAADEFGADSIADPLDEIIAAIYPTLAYIEDNEGARPSRLFITGFGGQTKSASLRLLTELAIEVEPIETPFPGLAGYLASLNPQDTKQAAA